jgi:hypothetical protein
MMLIDTSKNETTLIATQFKAFKSFKATSTSALFTMPKLLKILRGRKSSSSSDLPVKTKNHSQKSGIFRHRRSGGTRKSSSKESNHDDSPSIIVPGITFSLSEDEGSDIIHSPVSDIENQVQHFEELEQQALVEKSVKTEVSVAPDTPMSEATKESSVRTDDSDTMTFTHLEIMRNELAHMMQLAEKDKEIHALRMSNDNMQAAHDEAMLMKDAQVAKIQKALTTVEAALAQTKEELVSVNKEHSKAIEVLMKTQYELYELKHSNQGSWLAPMLSFFDLN